MQTNQVSQSSTGSSLKMALLVLGGLFFTFHAPTSLAANCPSGATMIRGKCTCPSGKVPSLDGRRCVDPASTSGSTKPAPKKDPKIKGDPAKGDSIPAGAKVRILSLPKDEPFYDIRSQLLGKEGVIYPDPMTKAASAPKTGAGYYKGIINIDGIEWYFYQVSISILDFGATPAKKTVAYGDFVPEGSKLTLKDVSTSDLTYYKMKLNKLVGQSCTVSVGGLVPNGGSYYSGELNCDDGKNYYFLGFTFTLTSTATAAAVATCDAKAFKGATPLTLGQRVKILDVSSLDGAFADKKSLVGKEGHITSATTYNSGTCWWEGGFTADDGAYYYFYQVQLQDLGKSISSSCLKDASVTKSLLGGAKVKILEVGPGDPTYVDRDKWKGKSGFVSGDLLNVGGCWFDGGVSIDGVYTYFNQIQIQELAPAPPTPACASDASKVKEILENVKVTVLDIAPSDLYFGERSKWVGQSGKITLSLLSDGTCWFNGEITFDNGEIRYFAKVQVREGAAAIPATPGGSSSSLSKLKAYTGDSVSLGAAVSILDIGNADIYYDKRASLTGLNCKVITEDMRTTGASGWFTGTLSCSDKKTYSFAQVAVQLGSAAEVKTPTPTPAVGAKFSGKSIKKGASVQIVEIASEDIYYGKRDSLVGKTCTAKADLSSSETGWFTGDVTCGSDTYSFFKVGLSLPK